MPIFCLTYAPGTRLMVSGDQDEPTGILLDSRSRYPSRWERYDIVFTDAKERHASNKSRWRTSLLFLGMVRDACLCDRCHPRLGGHVGGEIRKRAFPKWLLWVSYAVSYVHPHVSKRLWERFAGSTILQRVTTNFKNSVLFLPSLVDVLGRLFNIRKNWTRRPGCGR